MPNDKKKSSKPQPQSTNVTGQGPYQTSYMSSLPTKKAQMLNTSSDMPREIMSRPEAKTKEKGLKGLLNRAMEKAQNRYKKTEKVGVGGRKVVKEKSVSTKDVNGRTEVVREKKKTVTRKGR